MVADKNNIAFFDMDGTLTGDFDYDKNRGTTAWSRVAKSIGDETYEKKCQINDQWYENKIDSYTEWVDKTVSLYRDHGLTEDTYKKVINSLEYNEGVEEGFEELEQHNIQTVILTGGFKFQSMLVKEELGIDHAVAACELRWGEDGLISDYNVIPLNKRGKRSMMRMYKRNMGSSEGEITTSYVGDGRNDIECIEFADFGMAFDGHQDIRSIADRSYSSEDGFMNVVNDIIDFHDH